MLEARGGFPRTIRHLGLVLAFSASLVSARDTINQPMLYGRGYNEVCPRSTPNIIFEDFYDPQYLKKIQGRLDRIPTSAVNALGNNQYKIIILPDEKSVQLRNPQLGPNIKAYADPQARELVFYNSYDLPHELGHGADFLFGYVSLSSDFQEAVGEVAAADKVSEEEHLQQFEEVKEFNEDTNEEIKRGVAESISVFNKNISFYKKVKKLSQLPYSEYSQAIRANYWFKNYVIHIFVRGFLGYYYPELSGEDELREKYPKLFLAMERFNTNLEEFCQESR